MTRDALTVDTECEHCGGTGGRQTYVVEPHPLIVLTLCRCVKPEMEENENIDVYEVVQLPGPHRFHATCMAQVAS